MSRQSRNAPGRRSRVSGRRVDGVVDLVGVLDDGLTYRHPTDTTSAGDHADGIRRSARPHGGRVQSNDSPRSTLRCEAKSGDWRTDSDT